ncbi:MAG: hypothetical protein GY836_10930 [Herbaspirillum sp.]|uniref:hypothetical protein n=1 Tax=Herbaspirillum sp. TaxID=1890675 RepID=UPI00258DB683|nr:hypothetical protein [Herbaspirillum sp.]MCP4555928.1 hypothetical protein [Herbaspirillum sp.]
MWWRGGEVTNMPKIALQLSTKWPKMTKNGQKSQKCSQIDRKIDKTFIFEPKNITKNFPRDEKNIFEKF